MKLYRNAIILVIIVALLVGTYFIVSRNKEANSTDTASTAETFKLFDYTTNNVDSVTLKNPEGTFVLTQKGTEWTLTSPADIKADSSILSTIAINACSVTGEKLVEENAQDLAKYGLNNPKIVTLKLKDGTERTLEIGDLTPTKGGYYVKLSNENKVYVLGTYTGGSLVMGKNGLRAKELFEITSDMFTKISMDRKGTNLFSSELDKENRTWTLLAPIKGTTNSSALQPMFEALAGSKVAEFIEDKPTDLSKYGLDKPSYAFDFDTTTGGAFKLLLGDEKVKGSEIYAKLEGRDEVFTIDSSTYTFLDKPIKEIVDVFAYLVSISKVKRIDLTMNGKTDVMLFDVYTDKDGGMDYTKDKFTFNGKDATKENEDEKQPFRELFEALIGISLDDVDLTGTQPADVNPDISIKYSLTDGSTVKLDLVSKDENFYYVFRNGEYANILSKKNKETFGVIAMKDAYKKLVDFMAKQ